MLSKLTGGNKIVGTGASVAVICFFLPWVLVSCGGQPVASISGWQLAAGGSISTGWGSQPIPSSPMLFLVLLAALASLAAVYLAYKQQLRLRSAALTAPASAIDIWCPQGAHARIITIGVGRGLPGQMYLGTFGSGVWRLSTE